VRTRPAEAYKWIKGLKVGTDLPRVATDAVYHHTGGQKPELHLYSKCEQTVAIDLDSHYYGVIVFQVPDQTPYVVAQKIQQEVGLGGEIRDDQMPCRIKDFGVPENQIGWYVGLITSLFSLAQVLSSVPIGWLSDRFGRRPLLFLGLAGNCVSYVMFGMSKTPLSAILSRFLLGLVNGNIGVAKSMTGEITDKTNRPKAFALLGIFSSVGSIIGPMIGSALSNPVDQIPWFFEGSELFGVYPYLLPCLFSSFVSFLALVVGWFLLEETLHRPIVVVEMEGPSLIASPVIAHASEEDVSFIIEDENADVTGRRNTVFEPKEDDKFPHRAYPAVLGMGLLALISIVNEEYYPLLSTLPKGRGFGFSAFDIGEEQEPTYLLRYTSCSKIFHLNY
ncbi:UNVERIFIED_CONTAM: hypothetical protein HDU68_011856, partial [Siphonaria sp. JEL0065]